MMKLKIVNYVLIEICFVLKFMDVLITFIVIENGGVELNPLGYSPLIIVCGFIVLTPLIVINVLSIDWVVLSIVSSVTIIICFMQLTVINQGVALL